MIGTIIAWLVLGLIAGAVAKLIMPGKQGGGIVMTIILGIVGAIVGGLIGMILPGGAGSGAVLSIPSILLAIVGALVFLFVYGLITKNARGGRNVAR